MLKKLFNKFKLFFSIGIFAISGISLAACGSNVHSLTWEVGQHISINGKDFSALPTKVESGATISFSISCDKYYDVEAVKVNDKKIFADNNYYSFVVTQNTSIIITSGLEITDIEITQEQTKKTYFAGESVDFAGLIVRVNYENGTHENIDNDILFFSPNVFVGGETSFTILYRNHTVIENIPLVEKLVTIDPQGGTVSQAYIDSISSYNNFSISGEGVIKFSFYNNLPSSGLPLPNNSQILRNQYKFTGWYLGTSLVDSITNDNGSVKLSATWEMSLAHINKIELKIVDSTPCLIITGTFDIASGISLYLYEGNKKVEISGNEVRDDGSHNFIISFNLVQLTQVVDANNEHLSNLWLDICLRSKINDEYKQMEVYLTDQIDVNLETKITDGSNIYLFAAHQNKIKIYYTEADYSYRIDVLDVMGVEYIRITGNFSTLLVNKVKNCFAQVSWWINDESPYDWARIDANGSFMIDINLSDIGITKEAYAHFGVVDSPSVQANIIWTTNGASPLSNNLKAALCLNSNFTKMVIDSNTWNCFKYYSTNGVAYYIGYRWDGIMITSKDEKYIEASVSLVSHDNDIFYRIDGITTYYSSLKPMPNYIFDYQHNNNIDGLGWNYPVTNNTGIKVEIDEVSQTYYIELPIYSLVSSLIGTDTLWALTVHAGSAKKTDKYFANIPTTSYIKDGYKYSLISNASTWFQAGILIEAV